MKVLFVADYIYDPETKAFSGTKTGYGYMVKDILDEVSKTETAFLYTHKLSPSIKKNYCLDRHSVYDIISNTRLKDILTGFRCLFSTKDTINRKLHYVFYHVDKGAFLSCLKKNKPDIVHIHGATMSTKVYVDACEELQMPYIVTLHGFNKNVTNIAEADRTCEYVILERLHKDNIPVTVVSTGVRESISKEYGLSIDNVSVILNGVNTNIAVSKIKKQPGKYIIVSIGNICERKNQVQLIRSLKNINNSIKDRIYLVICGGNPEEIDIDKEINDSGMRDHISYLGYIEHDELSNIWAQADLNIVVSKIEGFGLSVVEGFLRGVPTLMFADLDAVKDLYNDNAMELIEKRDNQSIADAIERCYRRNWDYSKITYKSFISAK